MVLDARSDETIDAISVYVGTCDTGIGGTLDMTARDSSGGHPKTSTGESLGIENDAGGMLETGMNCLSQVDDDNKLRKRLKQILC